MLDTYVEGEVNRLSPEAPVPILLKKKDVFVLGGAGNVANNIRGLTKKIKFFGIVGNDTNAIKLQSLLKEKNIEAYLIMAKGLINKLSIVTSISRKYYYLC